MNIKTINQLEETNNIDGFYGIACDENGETKKYLLPQIQNSISKYSIIMGDKNISGLKGYYWNYIDVETKTIFLSVENTELLTVKPDIDTSFVNPYSIDDVYSLHDNDNYYNVGKITSINHNAVVVDVLPNKVPYTDPFGTKAYYFYVLTKQEYGCVDLGGYTTSIGLENKSLNICSFSEGWKTNAYGRYAHTEGRETEAGHSSHAEGWNTRAIGTSSHSEGVNTTATGDRGHAEGNKTLAEGDNSHAEGSSTKTLGDSSHAEGASTIAEGAFSHAEGEGTKSFGRHSHSEGRWTNANGNRSHSEGENTIANGAYCHAEGYNTIANGNQSHAEGYYTITNNHSEHACGAYNVSNTGSTKGDKTQFSVGIGTSDTNRKNAFEIRANGDIYIYVGATQYKLQDILTGAVTISTDTEIL